MLTEREQAKTETLPRAHTLSVFKLSTVFALFPLRISIKIDWHDSKRLEHWNFFFL